MTSSGLNRLLGARAKGDKLKIVETSLQKVLGNSASHMILDYLEDRCNLKREDIPEKMDEFEKQLESLLGNAAKKIREVIEENLEQ